MIAYRERHAEVEKLVDGIRISRSLPPELTEGRDRRRTKGHAAQPSRYEFMLEPRPTPTWRSATGIDSDKDF